MCQTTDIIATAAKIDRSRRINAVHEFPAYVALVDGTVINRKSGAAYRIGEGGTCTCPDFTGRIAPLRARAAAAGVEVTCRCKHWSIARLLFGRPVRVDNLVFHGRKK